MKRSPEEQPASEAVRTLVSPVADWEPSYKRLHRNWKCRLRMPGGALYQEDGYPNRHAETPPGGACPTGRAMSLPMGKPGQWADYAV